jgi:hypothetical protein
MARVKCAVYKKLRANLDSKKILKISHQILKNVLKVFHLRKKTKSSQKCKTTKSNATKCGMLIK